MWEDQRRRRNCQPPTKVIYREDVILSVANDLRFAQSGTEGAPESRWKRGASAPRKIKPTRRPLGLNSSASARAPNTAIHITIVILSVAKDLRFVQSRAEGAPKSRWKRGLQPLEKSNQQRGFRPELFHGRRGAKYRRSYNNCHPERSEGSAVCFKPHRRRTQITVEAWGFSPTRNQTNKEAFRALTQLPGCPIQALCWLEWDSRRTPPTNVILSVAKDLRFAQNRAEGAPMKIRDP
jgi:hypothetical protein